MHMDMSLRRSGQEYSLARGIWSDDWDVMASAFSRRICSSEREYSLDKADEKVVCERYPAGQDPYTKYSLKSIVK